MKKTSKIVNVLVACFFGFVGVTAIFHTLDHNNANLELIAAEAGGTAKRDWTFQNPIPLVPEDAKFTAWLHPVCELNLADCDIDDAGLAQILSYGSRITRLNLDNNPRLTDASYGTLSEMNSLVAVSVAGTSISAERAAKLCVYIDTDKGTVRRRVRHHDDPGYKKPDGGSPVTSALPTGPPSENS